MPTRKPSPSVKALEVPDYYSITATIKTLLLSLDRTKLYPSKGKTSPELLLPVIIAETKAKAYTHLVMRPFREMKISDFTTAEIADRIRAVSEAATALNVALRQLRGEAITILNESEAPWSDPHGLTSPTIADCEQMAAYLHERANGAAAIAESRMRKGRPPSTLKQDIALLAAEDFFEITGMEPARTQNKGQFPDFLRDLFKALNLKGKASSYIQDAVNAWHSGRSLSA